MIPSSFCGSSCSHGRALGCGVVLDRPCCVLFLSRASRMHSGRRCSCSSSVRHWSILEPLQPRPCFRQAARAFVPLRAERRIHPVRASKRVARAAASPLEAQAATAPERWATMALPLLRGSRKPARARRTEPGACESEGSSVPLGKVTPQPRGGRRPGACELDSTAQRARARRRERVQRLERTLRAAERAQVEGRGHGPRATARTARCARAIGARRARGGRLAGLPPRVSGGDLAGLPHTRSASEKGPPAGSLFPSSLALLPSSSATRPAPYSSPCAPPSSPSPPSAPLPRSSLPRCALSPPSPRAARETVSDALAPLLVPAMVNNSLSLFPLCSRRRLRASSPASPRTSARRRAVARPTSPACVRLLLPLPGRRPPRPLLADLVSYPSQQAATPPSRAPPPSASRRPACVQALSLPLGELADELTSPLLLPHTER